MINILIIIFIIISIINITSIIIIIIINNVLELIKDGKWISNSVEFVPPWNSDGK